MIQGLRPRSTVINFPEHDSASPVEKPTSIVDHILDGEPWSDDLVDAINDRHSDLFHPAFPQRSPSPGISPGDP
jgi:hypothetical protein